MSDAGIIATATDEAPGFATWEFRTRITLAGLGVSHRHADVAVEQAEEFCAETGQSAFEVFGPAGTYAADMAAPTRVTPRPWYRGDLFLATALYLITLIVIGRLGYNLVSHRWAEIPLDVTLLVVAVLARVRLAARASRTRPTPR